MKKIFFAFILFLGIGFIGWPVANVLAVGVAPALLDIELYPGKEKQEKIQLVNTNLSDETYYLDTMAFEPKNNEGIPVFLMDKKDTLSEWMIFSENPVMVPAGSSKEISFSVVVPNEVDSGTYYTAITISKAPAEIVSTSGVSMEAKTAVLLFVTVLGQTNRSFELIQFAPSQGKHFFSSLPPGFLMSIKNTGNVLSIPSGAIEIKNMFGQTIETLDINPSQGRILPFHSRTYFITWGDDVADTFKDQWMYEWNNLHFGYYQARLTLQTESGINSEYVNWNFWIIPWRVFLSSGMLFLIIVGFGFRFLKVFRPVKKKLV
ncbi:hypothetical protein CO172_01645 [Candidatus Uhrbacteria bacterium CG_4_9_14_3_um_filter_36_7]|uniref:DUF916 domain-containing protein n=1 Tax=Candidatus Uhrbacteria bacterium CG_4_9_14_3_um_filter_36_7 TaxID=1975033 RepID=A0A2M7XHM6_9BACT|nr:MAG: hypothetical protein CO172_01645 [Candidatus Uhrbacteria bacterium CG_4_9_14_3_um_filter_36_7]